MFLNTQLSLIFSCIVTNTPFGVALRLGRGALVARVGAREPGRVRADARAGDVVREVAAELAEEAMQRARRPLARQSVLGELEVPPVRPGDRNVVAPSTRSG